MLLVGGETYRKRIWSNAMLPSVSQSTEKGHRCFSVKLLETNSLKQDFPNQLDKRHHTTNEKVVLMTTDTFLKANSDSLSLKLAIKKR